MKFDFQSHIPSLHWGDFALGIWLDGPSLALLIGGWIPLSRVWVGRLIGFGSWFLVLKDLLACMELSHFSRWRSWIPRYHASLWLYFTSYHTTYPTSRQDTHPVIHPLSPLYTTLHYHRLHISSSIPRCPFSQRRRTNKESCTIQ